MLTYYFLFYLAPSVRIERTTSSLTVKRNYRCATRECSLAVRLRLELRTRLSPSDGLAIRSNTIIGPHQLYINVQQTLAIFRVRLPRMTWFFDTDHTSCN